MKTYGSVWMLLARSTICRLLILLAGMAAVEAALFWVAMHSEIALEQAIVKSRISWVCGVCFVLLTIVLARTLCDRGAKTSYTLGRLQIGLRSVFFCQAIYNAMCYFLFWAVQIFILLGLFRYYTATADASYVSSQSVFLAFYRNEFLHSLLPLAELSRSVRNGILMVGLGVTSAYYPVWQRKGKLAADVIVLTCLVLPFFASDMGSVDNDIILSAVAGILVIKVLFNVLSPEVQNET